MSRDLIAAAYVGPCPKCRAPAGVYCRDMRITTERYPLLFPHRERRQRVAPRRRTKRKRGMRL